MTSTDPIESALSAAAPDIVVPVLEERLHVSKRLVESGRARVHIAVSERDEAVEALLMRQDVDIERVTVGHDVAEAPPVRTEGDTIVVPVLEERLVVVKQLVLKEELRIRVGQTRHAVTETVRLRREHADIEQTPAAGDIP